MPHLYIGDLQAERQLNQCVVRDRGDESARAGSDS